MFNKIFNYIDKHSTLIIGLLLAIIVLVSYGRTLNMYWWIDDWAVVYKMIFPELAPGTSLYGAGLFGQGAYRYISTPFSLLYPYFHLNIKIYFALALIQYLVASVAVYALVSKLSNKKTVGLIAAVIFSSGFFGSYAMYRLSHSFQFIETILFLIIIVIFQIKYYQSRKVKYYFWSLVTFAVGTELMFIRAHGFLPTVLSTALIIGCINKGKKIGKTLMEMLPFAAIYFVFYFLDPRAGVQTDAPVTFSYSINFIKVLFSQPLTVISNFIIILNSLIIPDQLISKIHYLLKPKFSIDNLNLIIGILALSGIVWLIIKNRRKKIEVSLIVLGILWIISNFLIYFLYHPQYSLTSNTRYLFPSAVGTAIFYAGIFSLIKNKYIQIIGISLLCGLLIYYSRIDQELIIQHVSMPDKEGFALLTKAVKKIDRNTFFLVDVIDDPQYKNFILGGVPQMAIPPLYGKSWEAKIADDPYDFFNKLIKKDADINDFESFFYGKEGYVYTTNEMKNLLENGKNVEFFLPDKKVATDPGDEFSVDYPTLVPVEIIIKFDKLVYNGDFKVSWMTENRDIYTDYYFKNFNVRMRKNISFILEPRGRKIRKLKIEYINNPQNAHAVSVSLRSMSLKELIRKNYKASPTN